MYHFFIDDLQLPFAPPELSIKVGSNNDTVTLINEGEINVLKSPSLIEVGFEMRLPQVQYPFATKLQPISTYTDKLKDLKENKKSCQLIITRTTGDGKLLFDTNLTMALEDYTMNESADEGLDVLIEVNFKQYKSYGVRTVAIQSTNNQTQADTTEKRPTPAPQGQYYTIKSGDRLWNLAKKFYGNGSYYQTIYNANVDVIEAAAKAHGKKSSSNGHWIYPNTRIWIPAEASAKASSSSSSKKKTTSTSTYNPQAEFDAKTEAELNRMLSEIEFRESSGDYSKETYDLKQKYFELVNKK